VKSTTTRQQKNPNRWSKHLAPWFEESCKQAKYQYKQSKRQHGKKHADTKQAYVKFKESCRR
jgi:hypothetical protein